MITDKKQYYDLIEPRYISWDFYKKYMDVEPNFGQIGLVVFLRTYSRFVEELNRREKWSETILRVVEYSLLLEDQHNYDLRSYAEKRKEAEELFDVIFHHKGYTAGRTLWIGGTKAVEYDASANYNCSARGMYTISSFAEGFAWLLLGAGFGFSVEDKFISQLPKLTGTTEVSHVNKAKKIYFASIEEDLTPITKLENTTVDDVEITVDDLSLSDKEFEEFLPLSTSLTITVGDSKYGWVSSFRALLVALYSKKVKHIKIDYSYIRKEGERLKTFGGRSSGYVPLKQHFERVISLFNRCPEDKLRSVDVLDILNSMGLAVVVSGIRRSSEIALFDQQDDLMLHAKDNLWFDPALESKREIRGMSNNSIALYDNPGFEYFQKVMQSVKTSAEPGIFSLGNANHRSLREEGSCTNPCGEILLSTKGGVCNLVEANVLAHVKDGKLDTQDLYHTLKLLTRHSSRITLPDLWHKDWDKVQKKERLLGVSMTGIMDTYDKLNWDDSSLSTFWNACRVMTRRFADEYHKQLQIPRSLLVSTSKPSGSLSTLFGVSNGVHRHYAPYYIRRVRVSKNDPICQALLDLGIPSSPENDQGETIDDPKCNTVVFTFYCKSEAKMRSIDESAITQLERYKLGMQKWCEHNISCTISVDEHEWDDVAQWLADNYDNYIGVSFIPKFDPEKGDAVYPQLPFESITKAKYNKMSKRMPQLSEEEFINLISKYESEYEEHDLDASCDTGSCPVR